MDLASLNAVCPLEKPVVTHVTSNAGALPRRSIRLNGRKRRGPAPIAREHALTTVIDQAVQARLIASTPEAREIPACLRYERDDPFAVRISFPPTASLDGSEVEWTFGRELLAAGLRGPAGSGDVQMWPCGPLRTVLEFHTPEGTAMVQFLTTDLMRFLDRSYDVVPEGSESGQLDLDDGLAMLLGDAA
jgi:hypothetical protein